MKLRHLRSVFFSVLVTLAVSTPVWAQDEPEKPQPSWVMSYLLVTLCVGLGLFVVCRGTKREK